MGVPEKPVPSAGSSPPTWPIVGLRRFLLSALVAFSLSFLARSQVLFLERGLEFTDEGLYLLSANPASPSDSWWPDFGYVTRWLFLAVSYDIVAMRQVGLAVLLFVSMVSVFSVMSVSKTCRSSKLHQVLLVDVGVLIISIASVIAFYSWFIRTPGYDWLALLGALLSVTGASYLAVRYQERRRRAGVTSRELISVLLLACGASLFLYSRPNLLLWMPPMVLFLLWIRRSMRFGIAFVMVWGFLTALLALTLYWASTGSSNFLALLSPITGHQSLTSAQTPLPALIDFLTFPLTTLWNFWLSPRPQKYFLIALLVLMVLAVLGKFRPPLGEKGWASVLMVSSIVLVSLVSGPNYLDLQIEAAVATVFAMILLILFARLPLQKKDAELRANTASTSDPPSLAGVFAGWTLLGAFFFGAGSSNLVVASSTRAMPLLAISLVTIAISGMPQLRQPIAGLFVVVVVFGCGISMVASGYQRPLNLPSGIADQVIPTDLSTYGTVHLDGVTAAYVGELSRLSTSSCLRENQKVLGLEYQWSTTDVFLIKGWNPPSVIMGIMFANEAYFMRLKQELDRLPQAQWSRAWIMKSRPAAIPQEYRPVTDRAVDMTTDHLGTSFPSDYVLVATVGSTEFWAPRDSQITCDSFRDTRAPEINFPASVTNKMPTGWRPRGLNLARTW